ncbi:MAG TPA: hypothetical protein GX501_01190 [Clostridiaceae bacterium]|nr:hypothetical protein [Clostridiaceae bacterium]
MDNRLISKLLRGLKVTTGYITALMLFLIFIMPILTFARDNFEGAVTVFSFFIFIILFYIVYTDMHAVAFKEKRPQYNINPAPYRGALYGFIGIIPLVIIQSVLMIIEFPEDLLTLKKRLYQAFGGPLYWMSRLLGDAPFHYLVSFTALIIIAGLGYYAGHKDFYLLRTIREKLGIKPKKKTDRTGGQKGHKNDRAT